MQSTKNKKTPKAINGPYSLNRRFFSQFIKMIIVKILPNYFLDNNYQALKKIFPKRINDSIIWHTFVLRDAEKIQQIPENYLNSKNHQLFEINYFYETRKCYTSSNQEKIESIEFKCENDILTLGVAILEQQIEKIINSKENHELLIIVDVYENNKSNQKKFSIPLGNSRHGYFGSVKKNNFFDFQLDLAKYKGKKIKIILKGKINKGTHLAYGSDENISQINYKSDPFIAWSPKLLNSSKHTETKKIIILSFESMTSPEWLIKNFSYDLNLKSLNNLKNESTYFPHAVTQVDSTRPFIASMLYGLFASQHCFGDYSAKSEYKKIIPSGIKSIPQLLKQKSFYSSAYVPYSSFDSSFGFSLGFDSYICEPRPERNTVPDISWIIRSINSRLNNNQFIYNHLQYLHPPSLLNTTAQSPKGFSIESLSSAHLRDYLPLYFDQLKYVDLQLAQLVGYLKEKNIYDQTMLILLGDHGVGIPPWWKKSNNEYAHYEMRSRIPLYIKKAAWSNSKRVWDTSKPSNATIIPFIEIMESVGYEAPDYWNNINQLESLLDNNAIIETIFHPNYDNYAISLLNNKYKYWMNSLVDWKKNKIISVLDQKLLKYDEENDVYDETKNLIDSDKQKIYENIIKENQKFAKSFFMKNRNFYNKNFVTNI